VQPQFCGELVVQADALGPHAAGGKSRNLAGLSGSLPSWVGTPASAVLPFGSMEAALTEPANATIASEHERLLGALGAPGESDAYTLQKLRDGVLAMEAPPALRDAFTEGLSEAGIAWDGRWPEAWAAIKRVWASKFNERAWLSCQRAGLDHAAVSMAVLCQEVVDAKYAFVAHTVHPITKDADQAYAEVVRGLGETLVGNHPGRAFSFTAHKSEGGCRVEGYPSKISILQAPAGGSLICRSDSNAEDLDGFAGAGLYDSVTLAECQDCAHDYASDPLVTDVSYQAKVMDLIVRASQAVEQAMGGAPQDVEGVVTHDDRVVVVQARPQVL